MFLIHDDVVDVSRGHSLVLRWTVHATCIFAWRVLVLQKAYWLS